MTNPPITDLNNIIPEIGNRLRKINPEVTILYSDGSCTTRQFDESAAAVVTGGYFNTQNCIGVLQTKCDAFNCY